MTSTTPRKLTLLDEFPNFHVWKEHVENDYPDYVAADEAHDVVREKLNEIENKVKYKTQYSTTHDAALGILNELKLGFESGRNLGKREKRFAEKYLGMWDAETELYENLEESLEVLRSAKRSQFRKLLELEDQLPKLQKEEERLRKLWRLELNKLEDIYRELTKEDRKVREINRQQAIQDECFGVSTEVEEEAE